MYILAKKIFLLITLFVITCGSVFLRSQSYDLHSPKSTFKLPAVLREVSGITVIDNNQVACIQDELGVLFKYNFKKKVIAVQDSFYMDGDYEGITVVNDVIFVLRSDGLLLEINEPFLSTANVKSYHTNIPAADNEGLCYDQSNNRLLIASKSAGNAPDSSSKKRMVYAFDLSTKKLLDKPVLEIDISAIHDYLIKRFNVSPTTDIKFNPSDLAIHPISGKLYVLSADAHLLCVFNNGTFESAETLDPILFNKAEGISFFSNGDMIISNEGPRKGSGNVLWFKYIKGS